MKIKKIEKHRDLKTYHLGDDKMIVRFGKKEIAYCSGGMSSVSTKDPKRYEGDRMSKVYFDAQLREDDIALNGKS